MVTLRDIAKKAGVSTATVSNVLNESLYVSPELRSRVLAAVAELNYRPNALARSLRMQRSQTIGMIVPDITNPFFPAVVRGAEDVLTRAGHTLIIGNSDNDVAKEDDYYRTFFERRIDGLLTVATSDVAPPTLALLQERSIPIVYVDRCHLNTASDVVMADNSGGAHMAVRHLIATGRRDIAIITGPLQLSNARERLDGYHLALKEAGIAENRHWIREGDFDVASGYDQTRKLLAMRRRPAGIFASNAQMACGVLQALEQAGLTCPAQMALACFDQLDFFRFLRPRLTCVAAPSYELGSHGSKVLLQRLNGALTGEPVRCRLPAKLIQAASTAA
jgi:LacI family transcriptional regulator, galactose operon repressor